MNTKKNIAYGLSVLAILLSYFFIDQKIVFFFAKHHTREIWVLHFFADYLISFLGFLIVLFWILYCVFLYKRDHLWIKKIKWLFLMPCLTQFIIHALKPLFGRFWPDTFLCHNLSLLKNHVYGFGGLVPHSQNLSFPSGHAGFIVSMATGLWFLFPKFRMIVLLLSLSVLSAQLILYYHFLSDLIAGALIGFGISLANREHFPPYPPA